MNLIALNKLLRRRVGAATLLTLGRKAPVTVSENVRKQVLSYLLIRAAADGSDIFPTKQRIADELSLSKRSVQLAITTLLLPTPFGGPPILHKDGVVETRKGPADRYRIDLFALWRLPEIEADDEVLERTAFTSGAKDVHPTGEPSSSHPANDVHPERPSEKPMKDLGKTGQVFSAFEDKDYNEFLEAYPKEPTHYEGCHLEYLQAVERSGSPKEILQAAVSYAFNLEDVRQEFLEPAEWLRTDRWKRSKQPYRYVQGGLVR